MKFTAHILKKMETLYAELGYQVRYGQGNFNSGSCILKESNIVVINKLFNTESRINALIDLVPNIENSEIELTSVSAKLLKQITKPAEADEELTQEAIKNTHSKEQVENLN